MLKHFRILIGIGAVAFFSGCAAARYDVPRQIKPDLTGLTPFEETAGDALYQQSAEHFGLEPDPHYQAALEAAGKKLISFVHRKNLPYRFFVLNTDVEAGYAGIDGGIYISRGMIRLVDEDTELLAALLAHELAHVSLKHSVESFKRTAYVTPSRAAKKTALDYAVTILTLGSVDLSDEGLELLLEQKYSLREEIEADLTGAEFLKAAGMDPAALERLFDRFEKIKGSQPLFFSTHPRHRKRKIYVTRYIREVLSSKAG